MTDKLGLFLTSYTNNKNQKLYQFTKLGWAIIAAVVFCIINFSTDRAVKIEPNGAQGSKESLPASNAKNIPGLSPVDVYLNMEKKGFSTEKSFNSAGNLWMNKKTQAGIDYIVETYSRSTVSSVDSVSSTAIVDGSKNIEATLYFFSYVASLPYENSDPQKAINWLRKNFNKNNSTVIIGGAKFTIFTPSKFARTLVIEAI